MNCKNWDMGKSKGRARWWDKGNRRDRVMLFDLQSEYRIPANLYHFLLRVSIRRSNQLALKHQFSQ